MGKNILAGDRLAIYWPQDRVFYPGTVTRVNGSLIRFYYEDGEKEMIDLSRNQYVVLGKSPIYREFLHDKAFRSTSSHTVTSVHDHVTSRRVSISTKTSPENSSNGSTSASSSSPRAAPIFLAGKFKPVAAPAASSLAAFLSRKVNKTAA